MNNFIKHTPVLLPESISLLNVIPGSTYIDATFGGGSHAQALLEKDAIVIAIDQDEEAVTRGRKKMPHKHLTLVHDNFLNLADIMSYLKIEKVSGILFDLGTSAMQLEEADRGFSFMHNGPLDMRMNLNLTVTAKDLVNGLGKKEIYELLTKLAQEHRARAIAQAIVSTRKLKSIETTGQLAQLVSDVYGGTRGKIHPATKTFQALRIAVNDELNNLRLVLPDAGRLLASRGRLVVISFHQGEDKIVKQFIKDQEAQHQLTNLTKRPIKPSISEINTNLRARSAKLRAAEKLQRA